MTASTRGLQYSGPVIILRVQYGQQIQYNTIRMSRSKQYFQTISIQETDPLRSELCDLRVSRSEARALGLRLNAWQIDVAATSPEKFNWI